MQLYKIVYIMAMFALFLFLAIGGYALNRKKHWQRIWEELGRSEIKSVKELKALVKKQRHSDHPHT